MALYLASPSTVRTIEEKCLKVLYFLCPLAGHFIGTLQPLSAAMAVGNGHSCSIS